LEYANTCGQSPKEPIGVMRMSNIARVCIISVLLVFLKPGYARSMDEPNKETRAASILFGEFETVFYSKADLIGGSGALKQLSKLDADTLRVPFADLIGGLRSLGNSASTEIIGKGEAVLIGAKAFRPPTGLGSVQSTFCYVIVFGGQGVPDLHKYFSGSSVGSASGSPVWQWAAPPQEGHPEAYTLYIAQASRSYVLVSNDLHQVQETAMHLISSEKSVSAMTDIRDWKLISSHDYWGYRHYRHTGVPGDGVASGSSDVTPSAENLIFFADPKQRMGALRLLAADDTATEKLNASMAKAKTELPQLRQSGRGAWEAVILFTGDQASAERMFDVMGLFGFAVYL
jgi:hypothetical protein